MVVVFWIDNGNKPLWETFSPATHESPNASSTFEHMQFVTGAIKEMVKACALTRLPKRQRPTVYKPIGVVRKPRSYKFRLVISLRYVNKNLAKKVLKSEGLSDLVDIAEKGDYSVPYDLKPGYYHEGMHPVTRRFVGSK
jgi:hypothetical protein